VVDGAAGAGAGALEARDFTPLKLGDESGEVFLFVLLFLLFLLLLLLALFLLFVGR